MKRILLFVLAFVGCMQLSLAADRSLSFDDLYGGDAVDPTTGVITFAAQWWPVAGWNFDPAIDKGEYTGIKITFKEAVTANLLELKIKYVGVETAQSFPISKGSTVLLCDFTGNVESISFQSSNWENYPTEAPFPTITLESATLIAFFETEQEPLSLDNLIPSAENTVDGVAGLITFVTNWNPVTWAFDPPKSDDMYVRVQIDFAEPVATEYLQLKIKYVGMEETFLGLAKESTSIIVSFIEDVESIGIQNSDWSESAPTEAPFPTLKIKESYLVKKKTGGSSIPSVIGDNGLVDVYTILGVKVGSQVSREEAINTLPNGIYIMNNKKVLINK